MPSFKITEKLHMIHSPYECKLVVKENAHLKRKRKDMLLTQTLLSCKLNFDMIVECARSTCLTPSFAFVSGVVYITEWGEKLMFGFAESSGKLGLKMTNTTHTSERKMV